MVRIESPEQIIHVAVNDFDQSTMDHMKVFPNHLSDIGIEVSTGRVVDFRVKEFLRENSEDDTKPLIYPGHMKKGFVEHPQNILVSVFN